MAEPAPDPSQTSPEDDLFPSGPWTGYYLDPRSPGRHRMDLSLEFVRGRVHGEGLDDVAPFLIAGRYDRESLEVTWTKTYPGSHDVAYRGFRDGRGIWGTWSLSFVRGGFQIWPTGQGREAAMEAKAASPRARARPTVH